MPYCQAVVKFKWGTELRMKNRMERKRSRITRGWKDQMSSLTAKRNGEVMYDFVNVLCRRISLIEGTILYYRAIFWSVKLQRLGLTGFLGGESVGLQALCWVYSCIKSTDRGSLARAMSLLPAHCLSALHFPGNVSTGMLLPH